MGKNNSIPMKLNKKCAKAILMALGDLLKAATKAVKVVPIFAPMINGNALRKETLSVATNGTINDVVTVLECMSAVVTMPQEKALIGPPNT